MFASAFVLILIDIITPAVTDKWDLSKTFFLLDEMTLRGFVIAGPYKKDLLELDDLRQRLKTHQRPESCRQRSNSSPPNSSSHTRAATPAVLDPHLEQDMIWSWMANDDSEMGVLHPDTIQAAIEGLNFDFLNNATAIEIGCSEWMWGSAVLGGSNTPLAPNHM